jgi:hypothetical protein
MASKNTSKPELHGPFRQKNEVSSSSGTQRASLFLRWHEGVVTLPPATGVVIAVSVEVCGDEGCRWHYVGSGASHKQITPVGRSLWRLRWWSGAPRPGIVERLAWFDVFRVTRPSPPWERPVAQRLVVYRVVSFFREIFPCFPQFLTTPGWYLRRGRRRPALGWSDQVRRTGLTKMVRRSPEW